LKCVSKGVNTDPVLTLSDKGAIATTRHITLHHIDPCPLPDNNAAATPDCGVVFGRRKWIGYWRDDFGSDSWQRSCMPDE